ncbi:MAG: hypothetical protein LW808_004115 [Verrucomicrobiota bacterium]|nr:MAG: hypothetical protein LW808_004115 [Verrucomicrobiota bacterium]
MLDGFNRRALWRLYFLILTLFLQGCAHGDRQPVAEEVLSASNPSKKIIGEFIPEVVVDEKSFVRPKESPSIRILMLLWHGETEVEKVLLSTLKQLGYTVERNTIDAKRDLSRLKQELHSFNAYSQDYDYVYASGAVAASLAITCAQEQTPVIFSGVDFPMETSLDFNPLSDQDNVSGIANAAPIEEQLRYIQNIAQLAHLKLSRLAVVVNLKEQNSVDTYRALERICSLEGIELQQFQIEENDNGKNLTDALEKEKFSFDAIFITGDALTDAQAATFSEFTKKSTILTIAERLQTIRQGAACFGVVTDPRSIGTKAAKIIHAHRDLSIDFKHIPLQFGYYAPVFNSLVGNLGLSVNELKQKGFVFVPLAKQDNLHSSL